jgi:sec-independent protein translocase protein TatC
VIVTGPFGGLVLVAWDFFVCSKEAVAFLKERAGNLFQSDPKSPREQLVKPPRPTPGSKKKQPSRKGKRAPPPIHVMITGPAKGFVIVMKTGFLCGLGLTLPLNIFFLAQFVFPALTRKEKKYVTPAFFIGGVLFVIGLLFGYFVTLPLAMNILARLNASIPVGAKAYVENRWELSLYLGTVTKLLIANGVIFEMPLLLTVLVRIGVLSVDTLKKKRRHAIGIMLVAAAMLSPPDAPTMFLVAAPMVVMYEGCIWVSWLLMRKKRRREQEEEEQESYWEERKRIRSAEKVEPEKKEDRQPPDESPPEHEEYPPRSEERPEDYYGEDQSGAGGPTSEGEPHEHEDDFPYGEYGDEYWQEEEGPPEDTPDETKPSQEDFGSEDAPPDDEDDLEEGDKMS